MWSIARRALATANGKVDRAGDTMTGPLTVGGNLDVAGSWVTGVDELFYYACHFNGGAVPATRINTNGVDRWSFDGTTSQSIVFTCRMPVRWAGFRINMLGTKEATGSGDAVFRISHRNTSFVDSNLFAAKTNRPNFTQAVPTNIGDRMYFLDIGGVISTPPGGFFGDPNIVHLELTRLPADAADTYAGAVSIAVLGILRDGLW